MGMEEPKFTTHGEELLGDVMTKKANTIICMDNEASMFAKDG